MEIINQRIGVVGDATAGFLSIDDQPFGFVIEDVPRAIKVKGETRIKAGKYRLKLKDEITPLTVKYRKRFDWFDKHIELENVPDFSHVYIHVGNYAKDTMGCQVVGKDLTIYKGAFANKRSVQCYKELYLKIYKALEKREEVFYIIKDEKSECYQ